jgi:recombination protein RecT
MNLNMIKQAWKQGFGYKEDGKGTHQKFTDQMAIKTVKNRALKYTVRTYGTHHTLDAYENVEKVYDTDVIEADVAHDIQQNANTEEFIPVVDAEVVEAEVVETELPEFMSAE